MGERTKKIERSAFEVGKATTDEDGGMCVKKRGDKSKREADGDSSFQLGLAVILAGD